MKKEINLLSPEALSDRMSRIARARVRAIADALLVGLILIVCSYAAAWYALSSVRDSVGNDTAVDTGKTVEVERSIRSTNAILAAVDSRITQEPFWSSVIPGVLLAAPAGIAITKIELTEDPRTLVVVGKATKGSLVVQYQRLLESLPWVDHVVAPLQNFAVSPDATVTFTIVRKAQEGQL